MLYDVQSSVLYNACSLSADGEDGEGTELEARRDALPLATCDNGGGTWLASPAACAPPFIIPACATWDGVLGTPCDDRFTAIGGCTDDEIRGVRALRGGDRATCAVVNESLREPRLCGLWSAG